MSSDSRLKWIALVCLVVQNSGLALMMRYTLKFSSSTEKYLPSVAVLSAEVIKLIFSLIISFIVDGKSDFKIFSNVINDELIGNKLDWLKLTVPSILYTLQNSLQYFSMSQLSAPVFQVLYQLKIVTTAIFSVLILSRRISSLQWTSILALTGGVALVQLSQTQIADDDMKNNSMIGFISVVCGCFTSGFAGVYFEMVLKASKVSIWVRNVQLAVIGIIISVIACYLRDQDAILANGLFIGYDGFVLAVILLQAVGGLIVAVVVKYADNVVKGFATSLSILLSCLISAQMFHDVSVSVPFLVGAVVVVISVFLFGYSPQQASTTKLLST